MGTLKVFTGIATIGTAVILAVKGYAELQEGVEDIRENGINLPDLEKASSVLEGVRESLESFEHVKLEVA